MSRFYASIRGARGEATRTGGAASGITGHIRGWHIGVQVDGAVVGCSETDNFDVYVTAGSTGERHKRKVAEITTAGITIYHPISGEIVLSTNLTEREAAAHA